MNVKVYGVLVLSLLLIPCLIHASTPTDSLRENIPKVYISGDWYDIDFIKTEIPFVNYVIDRTVADVHILITTETTGSGGAAYTITFIGQHNYKGMSDTLKYISGRSDTEDIIRRGIAKLLKLGLMRYIARTPVADEITISFEKKEVPTVPVDRWKNWVFSIGVHGSFNGEQLMKYQFIKLSLSANRTTEEWKTRFSIYYNHNLSSFKISDTLPPILSLSESRGFTMYIVKSINDHWSIGGWPSIYSSTYDNMKIAFSLSPAIEYNIFPYSQSTSRKLCLAYMPGYEHNRYYEETLFGKFSEGLLDECISITLNTKQRWGSTTISLLGSHYFHDFTKNRLTLFSSLSLQLIKGLSFSVFGSVSLIRDQLSLPKRGLTPEEIMLRIRQLATQYDYFMFMGLTYSFGSLYSNVVNPRLERAGRHFVIRW